MHLTNISGRRPAASVEPTQNHSGFLLSSRANRALLLALAAFLAVAGGNATAAESALQFSIETPLALAVANSAGPGRRIVWKTQAGLNYELQTTTDLSLWTTLANVTAIGPVSWADDPNAAGDMIRYYRVLMQAPTNDLIAPVLSSPQATQPPPPPAAPVSVLSVTATDNVGVTSVDFLDGDNLLGPAVRGAGNNWSLDWALGGPSGWLGGRYFLRARAFDAAGNVGYSPVLQFDVAPANQNCVTFSGITICADAAVLAGGVYTLSGNIRINGLRLGSGATLTASASQISGSGAVIVPGLDTVLTGSFNIDPQTGWLTIQPGTSVSFPAAGIVLSPQANLQPTALSVNVFSNALSGAGSITVQLPNQPFGPAVFSGGYNYSPADGTASASGSMILSNLLSASGATLLNLNDASFSLGGNISFQTLNNSSYYLSNALVQLSFANPALPAIFVSGDLGISDGLSVNLRGNVLLNGQVELTGTARGAIGGFSFDPIVVTLSRGPGSTSVTMAQFAGKLLNSNLSGYLFSGTILSTGDLDIKGTGTVTFSGFVFNPLNVHLVRNAATTNQVIANLQGTLQLSYIKPINFTGVLRQDGAVDLSGQSGPYTISQFNGVAPNMNDPSLSFEQQAFIGFFHLSGRDTALQTVVNFHFTRDPDTAGGNSTLGVSAVTTEPTNPTLTLTGTASSTGACSLTGELLNQRYNLWGYAVNDLTCGVSRNPQGTVTFAITSDSLSYNALVGTSSQASGSIASDGSGSIGFNFNSCQLGGYALQNVSLLLAQSSSGIKSLQLAAGYLLLPGFASTSVAVTGSFNSDGTFNLTGTTSTDLTLSGLAVASISRGSTVTLTQNGLTITGNLSGGVLSQLVTGSGSATGTLAIAADGSASLSGCVTLSPLTIGQFQIRSTSPDGSFSACFGPGGLTVAQNTVRITYNGSPLTTPSLPSFTISLNGSFSIAVSAAMTAGLSLDSYNLSNASFTFNVSAGAATAQNFSASLSVPGFNPGFSTSSSSSLSGSLSSDGTFSLTGTSSSAQTLSGLAVTTLANGSTVNLTQNGLTITGTVSGGVLSQVVSGSGSANGTLTVASNGSASLSGCVTLSPLTFGQFQIRSSAADGSFSACFGAGLTVAQNTVRLTYNGAPLTTPTLPSFTIAIDGSFSIAVSAAMTVGLTLDSYNLSNASFTFNVAAGVASAQNFSASLSIPGFNPGFSSASASSLSGSLNSNGSFSLTGTTSSAQTLSGLAITTLANGSTVNLTQNGLTITGAVSGGVLSQVVSGSGSANGTLTIASNGSTSLAGCVTLSPLTFGQFQIRSTAADGSFSACFGAGLIVGQNSVRLTYSGVPLTTPTLPSFTIALDGSFSIAVTAAMTAGLTLDSYNLSNASFTFNVSAGVATAQNFSASLNVPGFNPGFSSASTSAVSGSLNSNGSFSLSGTTSSAQTLSGLAVTSLANGSTVSLTQNGLTITGTVSGGVLSQVVSSSGSANGTLTIASNGSTSLAGCVTLSPLTFGQFQIRSTAADGSFSACFGAGLMVGQNSVRLTYSGVPLTTPTLPSFTIALDGSFSIAVTAAMTAGLTLDSYNLSNASFTFNVSAGVATAQNFSGSLNVPGFNPGFSSASTSAVSGSLNSNGSFSLSGTTSSAQTLSGLAVTSLANGSTVSLTQNGLTITGTVSGGVLSQVVSGSGSANAKLTVASNGSASLSGCITLSPLTFGQFQIRSTAADGSFSACFGAGLMVGQNSVRLTYSGVPLTTPTLPSFTIALDGSFSIAVTAAMTAGLTLDSYNLSNASFTFNVSAGVATAQNFSGSLNVPGFNPGFSSASTSTVSGSLNSNGTFSLTGTTSSAQTLSGLAVTSLANGSTVSLTQNGLTISGTVSGGVLSQVVSGSGSANAKLTVASNGSASLSGCITLSPLTFGQFQIRSTAADGSFSACFGAGLTVAQNSVRLTYNGVPLTTPTLPSFTIALDGSFSVSVTAAMTSGLTLDSYNLSNASFLFSVSGGIATAAKFGATLTIPSSPAGFPKGAVALKVSGSLNSDATFGLSGTLGSSQALSASLPFADVNAGAAVSLTQTGLAMTGTFTGGVLSQVPLVSTSITLTIAADGSMTASGSVTSSGVTDNQISIGPITGTALTWNVSNIGLSLPGFTAQVSVNGVLSSTIDLPGFTMSANGDISVSVISTRGHILAVSVTGYAFTNVKLTVTRNAGVLSISTFAGNLNIPGFGQYLSGAINDLGSVTLDFNGAVALGGFTAATDGHLALRNSGLSASGTLDISASGTSLGSVYVTTSIAAGTGAYSASASTSLTLGGYSTSTFTANVSNSGLTGAPKLSFGNLSVYLPNLTVTTGGVSASGTVQRDSGWVKFLDVPGEVGDIYGRLEGTVSLSVSGPGSVNASLLATFGWWIVTLDHCDLVPPFNCYYNYGPDPIPADHGSTVSGGISSNGQFCVNNSICNSLSKCQNQFCFTLW